MLIFERLLAGSRDNYLGWRRFCWVAGRKVRLSTRPLRKNEDGK
jgi:hypothetical protein